MASTLHAIQALDSLQLQLIVTGMHLDAAHGNRLKQIQKEGWVIDGIVKWPSTGGSSMRTAAQTGQAISELAILFDKLRSDIVLVVGDRVEAFAAAAAGSIGGRIVAHIHGGDRALGQVDDSLRHAITKLSHLHFPATKRSAERILRMGEDRSRIHRCGSPGIDNIKTAATRPGDLQDRYGVERGQFALLLLHPTEADESEEQQRAERILAALRSAGLRKIVTIAPNNDPGSAGILRCWQSHAAKHSFYRDVPRADFLGLLRDAALLIGNSSSGIIEAASFGTPVIDVGDRQKGRERGPNVQNVSFNANDLRQAIAIVWRGGRPGRFPARNIYGGQGAGRKIAGGLAGIVLDDRLRRKLISY